ncbi:MAG: PTS sugar transporter subunit IIA [Clostridia bacterium]|nr:PTS sugar transporter subunit IIA [Clostridia bacterium]
MITSVFTEELMIKELKASSKADVIKEMVEVLNANGKLSDKEAYLNAVVKREEEFSTGIGMGVAIPHGKSSGVKEPAVVFARSQAGVDYESMDGAPAHLFFMIAVPDAANDEHLKILSSLSRKLMHANVREALMAATTYDEVIEIIK